MGLDHETPISKAPPLTAPWLVGAISHNLKVLTSALAMKEGRSKLPGAIDIYTDGSCIGDRSACSVVCIDENRELCSEFL